MRALPISIEFDDVYLVVPPRGALTRVAADNATWVS
jgi:hypothetical protein